MKQKDEQIKKLMKKIRELKKENLALKQAQTECCGKEKTIEDKTETKEQSLGSKEHINKMLGGFSSGNKENAQTKIDKLLGNSSGNEDAQSKIDKLLGKK